MNNSSPNSDGAESLTETLIFNGIDGASGGYLLPEMTPAQVSALAQGQSLEPDAIEELKKRAYDLQNPHAGVEADARDLTQTGWGVILPYDADPSILEALDPLFKLRKEQAGGKLVAMMGDGTNDAPALAQADVALAMNAGTQAAKEAANMVDLDSDPTKLIEVVEVGKQLLITRGALTTFSIANDVAKYFAIIPALFAGTLPWLKAIDIMHLHSPTSAILSAVIFNAIIIPALIPVALKGVKYRPLGADALLRRNLLIWGLGGVIIPFVGIKLIDLIMVGFHLTI